MRIFLFFSVFALSLMEAGGQHLSFKRLSVKEGMPTNSTYYACFDSAGAVWVSSNDGLISYNGLRIRQYVRENHPGLPRNEMSYLFCDSRNRIWVSTGGGLALVNEQRKIERVILHDTLSNADFDYCFEMKGQGIVAMTARKAYLLPHNSSKWQPFTWLDSNVYKGKAVRAMVPYGGARFMFSINGHIILADMQQKKVLVDQKIQSIRCMTRLNEKEIMVFTESETPAYIIHIDSNKITREFKQFTTQYGEVFRRPAIYAACAADGNIYMVLSSGELIRYDPGNQTFYLLRHDMLNATAVTPALKRVFTARDGTMVLTSSSGVSITNVFHAVGRQIDYFIDNKGKIYDGAVYGIAGDDRQRTWLKNRTDLFIWDKKEQHVTPVSVSGNIQQLESSFFDPGQVTRARNGDMWVCSHEGVHIYSQDAFLKKTISGKLPSDKPRVLKEMDDGRMAIGAANGFYMINTRDHVIDTFQNDPALRVLKGKRIIDLMPDGKKIWVAASPGGAVYCYDFNTRKLDTYDTSKGLNSTRIYCLAKDKLGNVYAGSFEGLNIIAPDGKIRVITTRNGLRFPRVENLICGQDGKIWISNFHSLIRYDPVKGSFEYFDERSGISSDGFTVAVNHLSASGEIMIGTYSGLAIFPQSLKEPPPAKQLTINRVYDDYSYERFSQSDTLRLSYKNPTVTLNYFVPDLTGSNRFLYRYKMERLDSGWSYRSGSNEVSYSLKPGRYIFKAEYAVVEGKWIGSGNSILVIIDPPWWQTAWFRVPLLLLVAALIYFLFRRRVKAIRKKSAIQQQLSALEAKALRAQMNPHFIFNCLNAIQELIITKNIDKAYQYLSSFSRLLRMVLNNSEKSLIPLAAEMEMIRLQLSLESLRFKDSFNYQVSNSEMPESELIMVPPLLLQPYVENAIWHGLRNKSGEKNLWIRIREKEEQLHIEIEDNGVGRKKAEAIRKQKLGGEGFASKGSTLSQQRMELLNKEYPGAARVEITDLADSENEPSGTLVKIILSANLK